MVYLKKMSQSDGVKMTEKLTQILYSDCSAVLQSDASYCTNNLWFIDSSAVMFC